MGKRNLNTKTTKMVAGASIQFETDYDVDDAELLFGGESRADMPLLITRHIVMFPGVISPIIIGRESSMAMINDLKEDEFVGVFCQLDGELDAPDIEDINKVGVFGRLIKVIEIPDTKQATALIQAYGRAKLSELTQKEPYYRGNVEAWAEPRDIGRDEMTLFNTAMEDLRSVTAEYIKANEDIPTDPLLSMVGIPDNRLALNFICSNMPFSIDEKSMLLEVDSMAARALSALKLMHRHMQFLDLRTAIRDKTREELDDQQKEYFLHQQMKNIREELGEDEWSPEKKELATKATTKKWSKETAEYFNKELEKLDLYNPQSPDYAIQLNYLQTLVGLPWNEYSEDNLDLTRAKKVLDKEHYGMDKVKERILEYMAVLKLRKDLKAPILCLYGPPGVGKTSLGKSIAKALNRKYVRMSLGGVHDESEIRGHRRTYVGAMPGRIIKSIQKAGTNNPVFILDEVDKIAQDTFHGDPSSALLEVLDPEQNNAFHDNYLDIDYDLSNVLFVATANDLGSIPRPLLDRMELVELGGYITEAKYQIAKRHLLPREKKENGIDKSGISVNINKPGLTYIIERYTRESGVRQLEKQIAACMRKLAYKLATEQPATFNLPPANYKLTLGIEELKPLLGKEPFYRDIYQGNDYAGVVTGLAWTSVGGEILFIETSLSKAKQGGKLTITGNLGDVMKESAVIALEYIKAHADSLGVSAAIFDTWNIHIHVPEGATPKDGPSAGITIATSIASALKQVKVRKNIAMPGEITLRGKVLPVGGIREKILAAKRAGITDIILCRDNKKDIEEINSAYLKGVDFHYVEDISEVLDLALTDIKVRDAVDFNS